MKKLVNFELSTPQFQTNCVHVGYDLAFALSSLHTQYARMSCLMWLASLHALLEGWLVKELLYKFHVAVHLPHPGIISTTQWGILLLQAPYSTHHYELYEH